MLSGQADQYSDYNVMHYSNEKLLADMGYIKSGVAIFLYGLLCVLVYWIRYYRENKT